MGEAGERVMKFGPGVVEVVVAERLRRLAVNQSTRVRFPPAALVGMIG